ncbi:sigma-54-dependent transcriptional regulator [Desulfopila aestuarii]|uniref:Response regulator receiver domain-containing protein n=1 Tax=Desulfopila aestuarii DSM 18488 TaxID=1121416 RepID=A0A1M7YGH0_9BACT|nr:sigma-54 dependent transcriptional regulator [Desulfopila aestuarii]SHO51691.1 Response regulator receiver domain-containing protein [Desulfopila aestuarii DSM 18488]
MTETEKEHHTTRKRLLIVDDEPDMLNMLRMVFTKKLHCDVCTARSGLIALQQLKECRPDAVVTDIKMPDLDGLELLSKIRDYDPTISTVIMTGYGTIDLAVRALKDGAYDFLQKPFDQDHIVRVVKNCLERTTLLRANEQLQQQIDTLSAPEGFIGQSPALRKVLDLISRVADTDATILIRGESGTGKELAARALHNLSNRKKQRMVTVNCPALPEHILESELFGYTRGAFTGATQEKKGLFLEADGSTIVLDEIADIPVALQTKLLRVLQEKEIQPLGQNRTFKIDARVVASTNQDLEAKIKAGEFREDLFYRLNVVTITMPNLQEMKEDIPLLIHHYLSLFKERYKREHLNLSPEVIHYLSNKKWPGNVRELRNTIKRIVLLSANALVHLSDIEGGETESANSAPLVNFSEVYHLPYNDAKAEVVTRFSVEYLSALLQRHKGNVTNAAADCGIERQGLQRLMRRYNIVSVDFKP